MTIKAPAIVKARTHRVLRIGNSCHPEAGLAAIWVPDLMTLILRCKVCDVEVMRAEIAKEFSKGATDGGRNDGLITIPS